MELRIKWEGFPLRFSVLIVLVEAQDLPTTVIDTGQRQNQNDKLNYYHQEVRHGKNR